MNWKNIHNFIWKISNKQTDNKMTSNMLEEGSINDKQKKEAD